MIGFIDVYSWFFFFWDEKKTMRLPCTWTLRYTAVSGYGRSQKSFLFHFWYFLTCKHLYAQSDCSNNYQGAFFFSQLPEMGKKQWKQMDSTNDLSCLACCAHFTPPAIIHWPIPMCCHRWKIQGKRSITSNTSSMLAKPMGNSFLG